MGGATSSTVASAVGEGEEEEEEEKEEEEVVTLDTLVGACAGATTASRRGRLLGSLWPAAAPSPAAAAAAAAAAAVAAAAAAAAAAVFDVAPPPPPPPRCEKTTSWRMGRAAKAGTSVPLDRIRCTRPSLIHGAGTGIDPSGACPRRIINLGPTQRAVWLMMRNESLSSAKRFAVFHTPVSDRFCTAATASDESEHMRLAGMQMPSRWQFGQSLFLKWPLVLTKLGVQSAPSPRSKPPQHCFSSTLSSDRPMDEGGT